MKQHTLTDDVIALRQRVEKLEAETKMLMDRPRKPVAVGEVLRDLYGTCEKCKGKGVISIPAICQECEGSGSRKPG